MKYFSTAILLIGLLSPMLVQTVAAQDDPDAILPVEPIEDRRKLAQTGMKFLSMSVDPRAAGMADANTALDGSSISMFYNPASMASLTSSAHASLGQIQWIADIDYLYASVAFRPLGERLGVFGINVLSVDYGEIRETIRDGAVPEGYRDTGQFYSPTALSVGLGYANSITDRFAVGANFKYVHESLLDGIISANDGMSRRNFAESTVAFDFGIQYRTGFRSMNFAMSVRNFSPEVRYTNESFELPLTFNIGVSMDMVDFTDFDTDMHSFLLAVDAERPRDYYEQLKIGSEYRFMNTLSLRAGYRFPTDFQGVNLGVGINTGFSNFQVAFDYAYTEFGAVGNVNRIGLQLGF